MSITSFVNETMRQCGDVSCFEMMGDGSFTCERLGEISLLGENLNLEMTISLKAVLVNFRILLARSFQQCIIYETVKL